MVNHKFFVVAVVILLVLPITACSHDDSEEGFAIYLPDRDMTIDELAVVSHIEIQEKSLISLDDIISYSRETHEIELKSAAYERIRQPGLPGKPFVVCVDREPIYAGAFMIAYFSRSYDGIVIMCPLTSDGDQSIRIQLGYPESQSFFTGDDLRSDTKIIESLKAAGKLK